MTQQKRPDDNDLIDRAAENPTPSHQGSAGGGLARQVGKRDELKNAGGGDPEPTNVDGRDKPDNNGVPTRPDK